MTRYILPIAVILLMLAAGLRFHALDDQSFWNDEGNSYGQSLRSPADIAINAAADIHPPGYYWLLAGWRVATGESEFALRSLSVFASILSAACAFALGRRLFGPTAGLITLAAVAVNTFSITYAQEARMYALMALWGVASTWALVVVLTSHPPTPSRLREGESDSGQKSPSPLVGEGLGVRGMVLALTTAAGLYTHYAYAGVLALHAVIGLAYLIFPPVRTPHGASASLSAPTTQNLLIRLTAAYGLALALFLPWLPTALTQVTSWGSTGDPIPAADAIPVALGYLMTGNTYSVTGISVAAALLLVMGLLPTAGQHPSNRRALWALALPPLWVALTVGGFLALGLFRPANLKFLLPAQIGMALWMGRGGWAMWHLKIKRPSRAAAIAPKFAALAATTALIFGGWGGLTALYSAPEFQRDDYRGIVQAIVADGVSNPAVVLNGPGQAEVFSYNMRRAGVDFRLYPLPIGLTPEREASQQVILDILNNHERIYGVFWGMDERDPQRIVETALAAHAYQVDDRWFGNVRLARYIAPKQSLPAQSIGADFAFDGGTITLNQYQINQVDFVGGDILTLELDWSADAPIPFSGVVTVQIHDADGALIAQRDSQPVGGTAPTQTWTPDAHYLDRHALMIPYDLAAAQYTLMVAVYTPENASARLPVNGTDILRLTELSVSVTQGD